LKAPGSAKVAALNWTGIVDDVRPVVEPSFYLNLQNLGSFERILNICFSIFAIITEVFVTVINY